MGENFDYIAQNLSTIRQKMDRTAFFREGKYRSSGIPALVAVTKGIDAQRINYAIERGICMIGENRADELMEKYDKIQRDKVKIHFIGNLQTNKVKQIIDKVDQIESVNSVRLAEEIDRRAAQCGIKMEILAELNIGSEDSKTGIDPDDALKFVCQLKSFENLKLKGLMTLAPPLEKLNKTHPGKEKAQILKLFEKMYEIFVDISSKKVDNIDMEILSMGMSEDFEEAISRGANVVRLGRAIFQR
ncbi:MAG: YggS family pyridoxal phosphate-dependent enzyme [Oscillospiraceae bacterium]|nr:YggS family pyridoxal phosphate-dependent enzyme [Oscillospiraceae bacterium]